MTDSLRNSIVMLRMASPRLNQLTDQASRIIKQLEEFLSDECRIGTHTAVKVAATSVNTTMYLEYRRTSGKFRIAIVYTDDNDFENETVKAWSECSRDEKLKAFGFLPELVSKIASETQSSLHQIEQTVKTVDQMLDALKVAKADTQQFKDDDIPF